MITKLKKIENLGLVFADFSWPAGLPVFKHTNLIYGWNGCGKTTLTRLFDLLGSPVETETAFEVEDTDGGTFSLGDHFPQPIRVFNQHYVDANVRVLDSSANSISILLGEENKDLLDQIRQDERTLNGVPEDSIVGLQSEFDGLTQKRRRLERETDVTFTNIAKVISSATAGGGVATRTYRAPNAKEDFKAIETPNLLGEAELDQRTRELRQTPLATLSSIGLPKIASSSALDALEELVACQKEGERLAQATVSSELIARLAAEGDISEWVEKGLEIHQKHASKDCEFCGNLITADRLTALAGHFSDADKHLKLQLDEVIGRLRMVYGAISEIVPHDPARFYDELQPACAAMSEELRGAKRTLLAEVESLGKQLQAKKLRTTETVELTSAADPRPLAAALVGFSELIEKHNSKSEGFQKILAAATLAVQTHWLSTIHGEVTESQKAIIDLTEDLEKRDAVIKELRDRIRENRAKISSDHKACEELNKCLATFLGRNELSFEPQTDTENADRVVGYRIVRGSEPATYLSEGERTAIAFVYFVVHLNDGHFDRERGIIVIDDPISSLDSNSLYQAFSFLKNAVTGCHQTFILTHSFEFLKLLLNWRSRAGNQTGYYMINNELRDGVRYAKIQQMDNELRVYESEYHYLFKRLKEMRAEQDGSILRAYPVPNMARKVWETFLLFNIPNGKKPYDKMVFLKEKKHDAAKLDAIYKFTNDQSHITGAGFDPSLVPEAKKVLDEIFEMMEAVAPDHYAIIDAATA